MPNRRKPLKRIRELIRMHSVFGLSNRAISNALNISRPVVAQYLSDFIASGLDYADVEKMDDESFQEAISMNKRTESARFKTLSETFEYLRQELTKPGVNLRFLWEEYKEKHPDGYSYTQFCYHYQVWRDSLEITMHMEHKAGEKMFVDFTGKKLYITNRITGEKKETETFIAILGCSQYTFVDICENQKKEEFIRANQEAMIYFGGVPRAIVPDCLKSGVNKYDRYEPDINPDFADFARHFRTVILPARARHPKDKALVENAVGIVYSRIYSALRNSVFYSIPELRQAVRAELLKYNDRPMQKIKKSRLELFLESEKDSLSPLPATGYCFKKFGRVKVQFNYHIYLSEDKHYYSVPFANRGKYVDLVYTESDVEIFFKNFRIASHKRDRRMNGYSTVKEHMPPSHRFMDNWDPERLLDWGKKIGDEVSQIIEKVLEHQEHPEQGFKICLGILNLEKRYGKQRLINACRRALSYGLYSYKGIKNILENRLDGLEIESADSLFTTLPKHVNIRGKQYYCQEDKE
jgi:transposase